MAFRFVFGDDDGVIYAVTTSGDLLWYRHLSRDGAVQWAHGGSGQRIGVGWAYFHHVFAGGDGTIYAVEPTGGLLWYRHLSRNGAAEWANGGVARQVGSGWDQFLHVFSGGDGIVYGVKPTGELMWYRHLWQEGIGLWAHGGTGQQIGTGWHRFARVFAGSDGIIYAVTPTGELLWFRHLTRDGRPQWRHGGAAQQIGSGWHHFTHVFAGGNGIIYGVKPGGELMWYRHLLRDGGARWAHRGAGVQIGVGWSDVAAAIEGYSVPLAAGPGEMIDFRMRTAASHFTVTYLRLRPGPGGAVGVPMGPAFAVPGRLQAVPDTVWEHGCGWRTDFQLRVPNDWPSGMYAARCDDAEGFTFHVTFIVKPSQDCRADFAVLANTNTWNAYNSYGGRSQYTHPNAAILSFERPNPAASPVDDGRLNHLARAETWVLGWLEDAGYRFDLYTDLDFHRGIAGLHDYRGLILHTHPEYWTLTMLDNLEAYLALGKRVLYLGGNGIYERVAYQQNFRQMVLRAGNADNPRDFFRALRPPRPERAVLGVAYEDDNATWDPSFYRPYCVELAAHRFFAGTSLRDGELIGDHGFNGAASGWEMDTSEQLPGKAPGLAPANIQVLARGTNTGPHNDFSAHMTYYDTPAGGFVFSTGSLTFGGSLAVDPHLQRIVQNVLNECLGAP